MKIKDKTIHVFGFVVILAAIVLATMLLHNDNKNYAMNNAMKLEQVRTDSVGLSPQLVQFGIGPGPVRMKFNPSIQGSKGQAEVLRQIAASIDQDQPSTAATPVPFPPVRQVDWETIGKQPEPRK